MLALISVPAVAAMALLAWFFLLRPLDHQLEQTADPDPERQIIEATLARTLRESQTGVIEPNIQAPPNARGDPSSAENPSPGGTTGAESEPIPPEGYEFVTHQGRMKRAPLPPQPRPEPTPNPPWLEPSIALDRLQRQARSANRDWVFAAVRLAPPGPAEAGGQSRLPDTGTLRGSQALTESLASLGARLEGMSGDYARIRVPADTNTLNAVRDHAGVLGLGAIPADLKAPPEFEQQASTHPPSEQVPVYITLMADDPAGEFRQPLADLGVTTGAYDPALRTYTANMPYAALAALTETDFVMAVEPIGIVEAAHDTSVPVMGADALRQYSVAAGRFSGITGEGIPIGVMDSGLNTSHIDIRSGRDSICGANFITGESWNLWADSHGHGTHVTGTIVGAGQADPLFAGIAPNVSDLRFAKVLSRFGSGSTETVRRGMIYLAAASRCARQRQITPEVKPLIVNMSLSASGISFSGRGVGERALDSIVHANNQLYVVAQANSSLFGFSNFGTAKNSLAVGAVDDNGIIAPFSSHGPTADNRLAPSLVGTGVSLASAVGSSQSTGYQTLSGTSMAASSVAGVAALLMEAEPAFRNQPALTRARLMASAIRPDAFLEGPEQFPRDNTNGPGTLQHRYGLGLVSARAAVLTRDTERGWVHGSATSEPESGTYEYVDVTVPEGASRLDIVMTWDEQPADTLTKSVLSNLDLWVDEGVDCTDEPCGEHSSRSTRDNIEWLFIDNPEPGTHRLKVVPVSRYGEEVRAAVAWTIIRGDATPQLSVHIEEPNVTVETNERFEVLTTVRVNHYLASGTSLHVSCVSDDSACSSLSRGLLVESSGVARGDGLERSLLISEDEIEGSIPIGEIAAGEERKIRLSFAAEVRTLGTRIFLTASSWNAMSGGAGMRLNVLFRLPITGGESDTEPEDTVQVAHPTNDNFADASMLTGSEGTVSLNLLAASREPGESAINPNSRTVWYTWTAPKEGLFRFRLMRSGTGNAEEAEFHLYTGDHLVALRESSNKTGREIGFSAAQGQVFRLRIGTREWTSRELVLQWESADTRPANDDFAFAEQISGESGKVDGTNSGATLERSEFLGGVAGTVWYEWIAPSDGFWEFSVDHPQVLMALVGSELADLRLVSTSGHLAHFRVVQGHSYLLAVASLGADNSGSPFTLRWKTKEPSAVRQFADYFDDARVLDGSEGNVDLLRSGGLFTVEPFEPADTGIASVWWKWTAPEDGTYVWRCGDYQVFRLSAYTGGSLETLTKVASGKGGASISFAASAGTTYWIALGRTQDSINLGYYSPSLLEWGKAPGNDNRADAGHVFGASGKAGERFKYATAEPDEPSDSYGHESLWWRWSAPSSGWYSFRIEGDPPSVILSLYPTREVGAAAQIPLASSERSLVLNGRAEAHLLARAGEVYEIRLSYRDRIARPEQVSFGWKSSAPPAFLRYVGAVTNHSLGGKSIYLSRPQHLAVHSEGTHVFVGSTRGLLSLIRDPKTGLLTFGHLLNPIAERSIDLNFSDFSNSRLHWSDHLGQLLAFVSGSAYSFDLAEGGSSLTFVRELRVNGNVRGFSDLRATSSDGAYLYFLRDGFSGNGRLQIVRIDSERELTLVQTLQHEHEDEGGEEELLVPDISKVRSVAVTADDLHVYVVANDALLVFSIDSESGKLSLVRKISGGYQISDGPFKDMGSLAGLALDASGKYLFVTGFQQAKTALFDVSADASNPEIQDSVTSLSSESGREVGFSTHLIPSGVNNCTYAMPRIAEIGVDTFCSDSFAVIRWDSDSEQLLVTDFATDNQPDSFGNSLPKLTHLARQIAQSPDGSHVYFPTNRTTDGLPDAIHVFERASAMAIDEASNHSPSANQALTDQSANVGEAFSYQFSEAKFGDVDGDRLSYTSENTPQWLTFSALTRSFGGTPDHSDITSTPILITILARDSRGGSARAEFHLSVVAAESDSN